MIALTEIVKVCVRMSPAFRRPQYDRRGGVTPPLQWDTRWNLLFVVHIDFEDDIIRIISARKATRKERNHYES